MIAVQRVNSIREPAEEAPCRTREAQFREGPVEQRDRTTTVLIADDEPAVLKFLAVLLREHHFTVLTARDGAEALGAARNYAEEHGSPLDLLITDFEMPQLNGLELAAAMQQLFPDIGAVVISGKLNCEPAIRDAGLAFLKKPFSPSALLETIESLL